MGGFYLALAAPKSCNRAVDSLVRQADTAQEGERQRAGTLQGANVDNASLHYARELAGMVQTVERQ